MKICSKCKIEKELSEFYKDLTHTDGYSSLCKKCRCKLADIYRQQPETKLKRKKQTKQYYQQNKEKISKYNKQYCQRPEIKIKKEEYIRQYYKQNKEKILEHNKQYKKQYCKEHKEKIANRKKERYHNDSSFKIKQNLKRRILLGIKNQSGKKAFKTTELLGCSFEKCKEHLESLFLEGMSWDNHGLFGWHIDHIVPCSSFDLTIPEEQKKCFHYTNLQPLWAKDNISKGNKIDENTFSNKQND
jgi:hypothetical protein